MASRRKPKLGQNFLVDTAACHRIVDALGDISHKTVFEIGPGHGAITDILAERAGRLICIELDNELAPALQARFKDRDNITILHADVLQTNLQELAGDQKAMAIGNLPYYITSDILLHLFRASAHLDTAVVMMQREVAERVAASPGIRDYGLLSVTAQMYGEVENLFTLPPEAFRPPPEVYSSVLRLRFQPRFEAYGVTDEAGFTSFLRTCFHQKRKTLSNNLRAGGFSVLQIETACKETNLSPSVRAEELSPQQLSLLFRRLSAS